MEKIKIYGYGSGYGDGSGSDSGYGYGDGYGYGSDSGYGYGDGKEFWESFTKSLLEASGANSGGAIPAIWRSTHNGLPANSGSLDKPVAAGDVHEVPGPLRDTCGQGQLHATHRPEKWQGERWWLVLMHEPVMVDDDKMWCLKRTIVCEIL